MNYPAIPQNEEQRLNALKSYRILDTLPEDDYDSITRLAALICNMPIAFINIIDNDRSFLKSTLGVPIADSPRHYSFCAHALNNPGQLMIIHDVRKDERFADNPLVINKPHIIFYAGMPLVTSEGLPLGTLCVADNNPNNLNEEQQFALISLSRQVMHLIELRKKNILLQEYQKKLELHSTEMENFAFMASHDLKDPLRMISLFLQKLKKNHGQLLDNSANEFVDFSITAPVKMTALINDLLDYAKLDKEHMQADEINVNDLITEVISYHSAFFNDANAVIQFNNLPHVKGVRTMLKIVLQNLLMNAVKFRKTEEQVKVTVSITENKFNWLFKIADNGIGIEASYFDEIFKPFRSFNSQKEFKGSGLGLAACRKIIERHGGKIWVESEFKKGSNFYFEIVK